MLVDEGVELETQDIEGNTPLHWAAFHGRTEIVQVPPSPCLAKHPWKILLEHGVNVDARDDFNETPLIQAATRGHADIVNVSPPSPRSRCRRWRRPAQRNSSSQRK